MWSLRDRPRSHSPGENPGDDPWTYSTARAVYAGGGRIRPKSAMPADDSRPPLSQRKATKGTRASSASRGCPLPPDHTNDAAYREAEGVLRESLMFRKALEAQDHEDFMHGDALPATFSSFGSGGLGGEGVVLPGGYIARSASPGLTKAPQTGGERKLGWEGEGGGGRSSVAAKICRDGIPAPSDEASIVPELTQMGLDIPNGKISTIARRVLELRFNVHCLGAQYVGLRGERLSELFMLMAAVGIDAPALLTLMPWGSYLELAGGDLLEVLHLAADLGLPAGIMSLSKPLVAQPGEPPPPKPCIDLVGKKFLQVLRLMSAMKVGPAVFTDWVHPLKGSALLELLVCLDKMGSRDLAALATHMQLAAGDLLIAARTLSARGITEAGYRLALQGITGQALCVAITHLTKCDARAEDLEALGLRGRPLARGLEVMSGLEVRAEAVPALLGLAGEQLLEALEAAHWGGYTARCLEEMDLRGEGLHSALEMLQLLGVAAPQYQGEVGLAGPLLLEALGVMKEIGAGGRTVRKLGLRGMRLHHALAVMRDLGVTASVYSSAIGLTGGPALEALDLMASGRITRVPLVGMNTRGEPLLGALRHMRALGISGEVWGRAVVLGGGALLEALDILMAMGGGAGLDVLASMELVGEPLLEALQACSALGLSAAVFASKVELSGDMLLATLRRMCALGMDSARLCAAGVSGALLFEALQAMEALGLPAPAVGALVVLEGEQLVEALGLLRWARIAGPEAVEALGLSGPPLLEALRHMQALAVGGAAYDALLSPLSGGALLKALHLMAWGGYSASAVEAFALQPGGAGAGAGGEAAGSAAGEGDAPALLHVLGLLRWAEIPEELFRGSVRLEGGDLQSALSTMQRLGMRGPEVARLHLAGGELSSALESMRVLGLGPALLAEVVQLEGPQLGAALSAMHHLGYDARVLLKLGLRGEDLAAALGQAQDLSITAAHYEESIQLSGAALKAAFADMRELEIHSVEALPVGPALAVALSTMRQLGLRTPDPFLDGRGGGGGGLLGLRGEGLEEALALMLPLGIDAEALKRMGLAGDKLLQVLRWLKGLEMRKGDVLELRMGGLTLFAYLEGCTFAVEALGLSLAGARRMVGTLRASGVSDGDVKGAFLGMQLVGPPLEETVGLLGQLGIPLMEASELGLSADLLLLTLRRMVAMDVPREVCRALGLQGGAALCEVLRLAEHLGFTGARLDDLGLRGESLAEAVGHLYLLAVPHRVWESQVGLTGPQLLEALRIMRSLDVTGAVVAAMAVPSGGDLIETLRNFASLEIDGALYLDWVAIAGPALPETMRNMRWGHFSRQLVPSLGLRGGALVTGVQALRALGIQADTFRSTIRLSGPHLTDCLTALGLCRGDKKMALATGLQGAELRTALRLMVGLQVTAEEFYRDLQLSRGALTRALEIMQWGGYNAPLVSQLELVGEKLLSALEDLEWLGITADHLEAMVRLRGAQLLSTLATARALGLRAPALARAGLGAGQPLAEGVERMLSLGVDAHLLETKVRVQGAALERALALMVILQVDRDVLLDAGLEGAALAGALEDMRSLGIDGPRLRSAPSLAAVRAGPLAAALGLMRSLGIRSAEALPEGASLVPTLQSMLELELRAPDPFLDGHPGGLLGLRGRDLQAAVAALRELGISAAPLKGMRVGGEQLAEALGLMRRFGVGGAELSALGLSGQDLLGYLRAVEAAVVKSLLPPADARAAIELLAGMGVPSEQGPGLLAKTGLSEGELRALLEAMGRLGLDTRALMQLRLRGGRLRRAVARCAALDIDAEVLSMLGVEGERLEALLEGAEACSLSGPALRGLGLAGQSLVVAVQRMRRIGLTGAWVVGTRRSGGRLMDLLALLEAATSINGFTLEQSRGLLEVIEAHGVPAADSLRLMAAVAGSGLPARAIASAVEAAGRDGARGAQVVARVLSPPPPPEVTRTAHDLGSTPALCLEEPQQKAARAMFVWASSEVADYPATAVASSGYGCWAAGPASLAGGGAVSISMSFEVSSSSPGGHVRVSEYRLAGPREAVEGGALPTAWSLEGSTDGGITWGVLLDTRPHRGEGEGEGGEEEHGDIDGGLAPQDEGTQGEEGPAAAGASEGQLSEAPSVLVREEGETEYTVRQPRMVNAVRLTVTGLPPGKFAQLGRLEVLYWDPPRPHYAAATPRHCWASHEAPWTLDNKPAMEPAACAFDGNIHTSWTSRGTKFFHDKVTKDGGGSRGGDSGRGGQPPWAACTFLEGLVMISSYQVASSGVDVDRNPTEWRLEGSTDGGLTWPLVLHEACDVRLRVDPIRFRIRQPTPVNAVRITVTGIVMAEAGYCRLEFLTFSQQVEANDLVGKMLLVPRGGTVAASSERAESGRAAANLFDAESDSPWASAGGAPQWVSYRLGAPQRVHQYVLQSSGGAPECDPRHWVLEGSYDGGKTFPHVLDERREEFFSRRYLRRTFVLRCPPSPECDCFRLVVRGVANPPAAEGVQLQAVELFYMYSENAFLSDTDDPAMALLPPSPEAGSMWLPGLGKDSKYAYLEVPPRWRQGLGMLSSPGRFTVALWVKTHHADIYPRALVAKPAGVSRPGWAMVVKHAPTKGGDVVIVGGVSRNGRSLIRMQALLPRGVWTHVCATYDGVKEKLYINGMAAGEANMLVGPFDGTNQPLLIGHEFPSSSKQAMPSESCGLQQASVADVAAWSTALVSSEVQHIINQGVQAAGVQRAHSVGHWRFEEPRAGAEGLVRDSSGCGNHAVLRGGAEIRRETPW